MFSTLTPEDVMQELLKTCPLDIAFLEFQNKIYYSSESPAQKSPISAVTTLIQGIYENFPTQARHIIRNRIYSSAPASAMDYGMVKVAAKRITNSCFASERPTSFFLEKALVRFTPFSQDYWPQVGAVLTHPSEIIRTLQTMSQTVHRDTYQYQSDRPIAALLVSNEGQVLSWGTNTNGKNKTLHAEVNLIQSFYLKTKCPIPPGCTIYTSLKPCKMCAGMIWSSAIDPTTIQVYYLEEDPGPMAQQTVLDLNSSERKRASQNSRELYASIQKKI